MSIKSPAFFFNAAALSDSELQEIRVDRDKELRESQQALQSRHNVLLHGERGLGKTFLARLLCLEIQKADPTALPIFMSMAGLHAYSPHDSVGAFPRSVLLQACAAIWRTLADRSYLDIRATLDESGAEITLRTRAERLLVRIYKLLMHSDKRSQFEFANSVGFVAGLKGEKSEKTKQSFLQSDVLPFEFAELADELRLNVLPEYGKRRIIAICDEANLLPLQEQESILTRHLELFASKHLQFVFVVSHLAREVIELPAAFETRIEVCRLDKLAISELLKKIMARGFFDFAEDVVDILFEHFGGHPRVTLEAAAQMHGLAQEQQIACISAEAAQSFCVNLQMMLDGQRAHALTAREAAKSRA